MPSVRSVPVGAGRPPVSRRAGHLPVLRSPGRVAEGREARGRPGRIVVPVMLGLGATAAIVAIVALLVFSALVGLLSIGLPDPTRLDTPTTAHLTLVSDRTGVILPPASLGR